MAQKVITQFDADTKGLTSKVDKATGRAKKSIKGVDTATQKLSGSFKALGATLIAAFGAQQIIQQFTQTIRTFQNFEQAIANLGAISQASGKELSKLSGQAKNLGATTKFTATEVAGLQTNLAKLGFTTKEITDATPGILALAAATGEDLAMSADVAGATIRGFGLDASKTGEIVDIMAASFSKSALDLSNFQEAMKLVAPIAKAANIPVGTTTALLGKLADAGLRGSIAGTSLKNLLSKLADENSDLSKQLGFAVTDTESLFKAFDILKDSNIDLTAATELTDERSKATFLTLIEGADAARQLTEELDNAAGTADRMATQQLDTLEGSLTLLKSAFDGLQISVGEKLAPSLRSAADGLTATIDAVRENKEEIKTFGGVVATAGAFLLGFKGSLLLVNVATKSYEVVTKIATFATKGFSAALRANPLGLIVGLLAAATSSLLFFKKEKKAATKVEDEFNDELAETNRLLKEQELALSKQRKTIGQLVKDGNAQNVTLKDLEQALSVAKKKLDDFTEAGAKRQIQQENLIFVDEKGNAVILDQAAAVDALRDTLLREVEGIEQAIKAKKDYLAGAAGQTKSVKSLKERLGELKKEMLAQALAGKVSAASLAEFNKIVKQLTEAQLLLKSAMAGDALIPDIETEDTVDDLVEPFLTLEDSIKRIYENIVGTVEESGQAAIDASDKAADAAVEDQKRIQAEIDATSAKRIEDAQLALQAANQLGGALFDIIAVHRANDLANLEEQKAYELELAGDNEQQREAIEDKFAKKTRAIKKKQAEEEKVAAMFKIILDTAANAVSLFAQTVPPGILSALAIAFGAIQLGTVAAQPVPQFAEGTPFVGLNGNKKGRDTVPAMLSEGERVIPAAQNKANWSLYNAIEKGTLDKYIMQNYVLPQISPSNVLGGSFAANVGKAIKISNKLNDQNIVSKLDQVNRSILSQQQPRFNPRKI